MITYFKQATLVIALAGGTIMASGAPAQAACGLECWLSNTFSTNDFVGDWLRDTFGGIRKTEDTEGDGKLVEMLMLSDRIVEDWEPGQKLMDRETAMRMQPRCKLPELVKVVNDGRSPEALLGKCFAKGK